MVRMARPWSVYQLVPRAFRELPYSSEAGGDLRKAIYLL